VFIASRFGVVVQAGFVVFALATLSAAPLMLASGIAVALVGLTGAAMLLSRTTQAPRPQPVHPGGAR
jgi:hypothetical protein